MKETLEFLVIGAQKCGTTALYEYVKSHPQIVVPIGKEAPFFNIEDYYRKGFPAFLNDQFPRQDPRHVWGTISPQYMTNKIITDRVAATLPDAQIVALLRDPVSRARSHYKMSVRRLYEARSIEDAFQACLEADALEKARTLPAAPESESSCYLVWSEYGRILAEYAKHYRRDQMLILFFEDLIKDPAATLDKFFEFLGVSTGYRPANLGEKIFPGSTESRFPHLKHKLQQTALSAIWSRLPRAWRGRISFAFERFNSRKNADNPVSLELSDELTTRLVAHFAEDIKQLEDTFGITTPWTYDVPQIL